MEENWFVGTLEQLWQNVELPIRENASLPNQLGTLCWGMSGEGEEPVVMPRQIVGGLYAIPVPEDNLLGKAWNGFNAEQLMQGVSYPQTPLAQIQFLEL